MSVEIDNFVKVDISLSPAALAYGNFGVLAFLSQDTVVDRAERSIPFTSLAGVAEIFATTSEVYKAATAFYAQTPAPRDFVVITQYTSSASAGSLLGSGFSLEDVVAQGLIDLKLSVDAIAETVVKDIDVSGAQTKTDVASIIETALKVKFPKLSVTLNRGRLLFVSGTTGITSKIGTITDGTTPGVTDLLGISVGKARSVIGLDKPETAVEAIQEGLESGVKFVALAVTQKLRDTTEALLVADTCEALKVLFMYTSNNHSVLDSSSTTDNFSKMKLKSLNYTHMTFSRHKDEYPGCSVFGRIASVNYSGINTTITLNLKQAPTITAERLSSGEFAALEAKNGNAVVVIGGAANAFVSSRMASGTWLDTTHGLMWLRDKIQKDMFNLLYTTNTKIPYTTTGINMLKATLAESLDQAVLNGFAAPGYLPDGSFAPLGYVITSVPLDRVGSAEKSNRIYNGLGFKIVGAGALHTVKVSGEFSE